MRIALIACTKTKNPEGQKRPLWPAALYGPSALFRAAQEHAEAYADGWMVLSAKHGLLRPDDRVSWYDETLSGAPKARRQAWTEQVVRQFEARGLLGQGTVWELHAGRDYTEFLAARLRELGETVEDPLAGLQIGERKGWYARERAARGLGWRDPEDDEWGGDVEGDAEPVAWAEQGQDASYVKWYVTRTTAGRYRVWWTDGGGTEWQVGPSGPVREAQEYRSPGSAPPPDPTFDTLADAKRIAETSVIRWKDDGSAPYKVRTEGPVGSELDVDRLAATGEVAAPRKSASALLEAGLASLRARGTPEAAIRANMAELVRLARAKIDRLTILRCGLGRDSLTMLALLLEEGLVAGGERLRAADVDAVVFTDPGFEWESTYALIPEVERVCREHHLRFLVQRKPPAEGWDGWRAWNAYLVEARARAKAAGARRDVELPPWRRDPPATIEERCASGYYHARAPIIADYRSKETIIAFTDPSCTANHKIGPNRALLSDMTMERWGIRNRAWSLDVRNGVRRPHRVLLGIAADESERAIADGGPAYELNLYPLVEMGISKADEAAILARWGWNHAHKSGCAMCKFQPRSWFWALSEVEPAKYAEAVEYERAALARNPKLFLFPDHGPLEDAVRKWREKNPRATVEAVLAKEYKRCDSAATGKVQTCSIRSVPTAELV